MEFTGVYKYRAPGPDQMHSKKIEAYKLSFSFPCYIQALALVFIKALIFEDNIENWFEYFNTLIFDIMCYTHRKWWWNGFNFHIGL